MENTVNSTYEFCFSFRFLLSAALVCFAVAEKSDKPNIVVITADDLVSNAGYFSDYPSTHSKVDDHLV